MDDRQWTMIIRPFAVSYHFCFVLFSFDFWIFFLSANLIISLTSLEVPLTTCL